jgi:hypothetical protein
MSLFVDQAVLRFSAPARLIELLAPAGDPTHIRLRSLLDAMYDLPFATLHDVFDVEVRRIELQRPLFSPDRTHGNWTQTIPSHIRTDVVYESLNDAEPVWLDISAEVSLTLVLEVDANEVESILTRQIDEFNTLDEFRAHFRFIDLDAFMANHGFTTVEELRKQYHYLLTEIRLRTPEPFNPDDPANQHRYSLNLVVLIRDTIDVAAALRDVKLAQNILKRALTYRREVDEAEVRTPYAPLIIFPESALTDLPFSADDLQSLFAAERILVLFVTPS